MRVRKEIMAKVVFQLIFNEPWQTHWNWKPLYHWVFILNHYVSKGFLTYKEVCRLAEGMEEDFKGGVTAEKQKRARFEFSRRCLEKVKREKRQPFATKKQAKAERHVQWRKQALIDGHCPVCGEEKEQCTHGYDKVVYVPKTQSFHERDFSF